MNSIRDARIVWLVPSAWFNWQPFLGQFTQLFPKTTVLTARWPGFAQGFENAFPVEVIGKMKFIQTTWGATGYNPGFTYLSPRIIGRLLQLKPHLIFTDSFGLWTVLALLFKPIGKWRVSIAYEGSSPGIDYRGSVLRLWIRRTMVKMADACITNSQAGKNYLIEVLQANPRRVFARPYEIPIAKSILGNTEQPNSESRVDFPDSLQPIFLYVAQIVPRKGLRFLLQACTILRQRGYCKYTLWVVGSGEQREELERFSREQDLQTHVKWIGVVEQNCVGAYFSRADVFILPTLEDTWGMVVLEAMLLGKPILCSKWAGAVDMVADGENGYVFDPHEPEKLADLMSQFISNPNLSKKMGEKSRQIMTNHTPQAVASFLAEVVEFVLPGDELFSKSPHAL